MPESAPNWKTLRTDLRKHLHRMHGSFGDGGTTTGMSVEQLEETHRLLHDEDAEYMCPPHVHIKSEKPWDFGRVELSYGEDFEEEIVRAVKGEL